MMNDKRGHRRLRLCSRKHYQPKPRKQPLHKEESLLVSIPLSNISIQLKVTLPLSSYTDGQVVSLNLLHNRMERCGFLPSGMICLYCFAIVAILYFIFFRME